MEASEQGCQPDTMSGSESAEVIQEPNIKYTDAPLHVVVLEVAQEEEIVSHGSSTAVCQDQIHGETLQTDNIQYQIEIPQYDGEPHIGSTVILDQGAGIETQETGGVQYHIQYIQIDNPGDSSVVLEEGSETIQEIVRYKIENEQTPCETQVDSSVVLEQASEPIQGTETVQYQIENEQTHVESQVESSVVLEQANGATEIIQYQVQNSEMHQEAVSNEEEKERLGDTGNINVQAKDKQATLDVGVVPIAIVKSNVVTEQETKKTQITNDDGKGDNKDQANLSKHVEQDKDEKQDGSAELKSGNESQDGKSPAKKKETRGRKRKGEQTDEKPYSCPTCDTHFTRQSSLTLHAVIHTGAKPYNCPSCTASFTQQSSLTRHMRTHAGVRPHQCTFCDATFTTRGHCVIHMRTHTGERPFECPSCPAGFAQRSTLTTHMRTHTGEKPYVCAKCGACFSQKSHLTTHMKTHNRDTDDVVSKITISAENITSSAEVNLITETITEKV